MTYHPWSASSSGHEKSNVKDASPASDSGLSLGNWLLGATFFLSLRDLTAQAITLTTKLSRGQPVTQTESFARFSAVLMIVAIAAGCSGKTFNKFDVDKGESVTIDASQRAIIVTNSEADGRRLVCAEPSPDALTAFAGEVAAKASIDNADVAAELSGALRETAASIGVRTATIQLMRDLLYRACEARLNGLFTAKNEAMLVATRVDNVIIGLHAIDRLTGVSPAPVTIVSPQAGSAKTNEGGTRVGPSEDAAGSQVLHVKVSYEGLDTDKFVGIYEKMAMSVENIVRMSLGIIEKSQEVEGEGQQSQSSAVQEDGKREYLQQ